MNSPPPSNQINYFRNALKTYVLEKNALPTKNLTCKFVGGNLIFEETGDTLHNEEKPTITFAKEFATQTLQISDSTIQSLQNELNIQKSQNEEALKLAKENSVKISETSNHDNNIFSQAEFNQALKNYVHVNGMPKKNLLVQQSNLNDASKVLIFSELKESSAPFIVKGFNEQNEILINDSLRTELADIDASRQNNIIEALKPLYRDNSGLDISEAIIEVGNDGSYVARIVSPDQARASDAVKNTTSSFHVTITKETQERLKTETQERLKIIEALKPLYRDNPGLDISEAIIEVGNDGSYVARLVSPDQARASDAVKNTTNSFHVTIKPETKTKIKTEIEANKFQDGVNTIFSFFGEDEPNTESSDHTSTPKNLVKIKELLARVLTTDPNESDSEKNFKKTLKDYFVQMTKADMKSGKPSKLDDLIIGFASDETLSESHKEEFLELLEINANLQVADTQTNKNPLYNNEAKHLLEAFKLSSSQEGGLESLILSISKNFLKKILTSSRDYKENFFLIDAIEASQNALSSRNVITTEKVSSINRDEYTKIQIDVGGSYSGFSVYVHKESGNFFCANDNLTSIICIKDIFKDLELEKIAIETIKEYERTQLILFSKDLLMNVLKHPEKDERTYRQMVTIFNNQLLFEGLAKREDFCDSTVDNYTLFNSQDDPILIWKHIEDESVIFSSKDRSIFFNVKEFFNDSQFLENASNQISTNNIKTINSYFQNFDNPAIQKKRDKLEEEVKKLLKKEIISEGSSKPLQNKFKELLDTQSPDSDIYKKANSLLKICQIDACSEKIVSLKNLYTHSRETREGKIEILKKIFRFESIINSVRTPLIDAVINSLYPETQAKESSDVTAESSSASIASNERDKNIHDIKVFLSQLKSLIDKNKREREASEVSEEQAVKNITTSFSKTLTSGDPDPSKDFKIRFFKELVYTLNTPKFIEKFDFLNFYDEEPDQQNLFKSFSQFFNDKTIDALSALSDSIKNKEDYLSTFRIYEEKRISNTQSKDTNIKQTMNLVYDAIFGSLIKASVVPGTAAERPSAEASRIASTLTHTT